jgi:hypothetical protein
MPHHFLCHGCEGRLGSTSHIEFNCSRVECRVPKYLQTKQLLPSFVLGFGKAWITCTLHEKLSGNALTPSYYTPHTVTADQRKAPAGVNYVEGNHLHDSLDKLHRVAEDFPTWDAKLKIGGLRYFLKSNYLRRHAGKGSCTFRGRPRR